MSAADDRWMKANQQYLTASVAQIKAMLERRAEAGGTPIPPLPAWTEPTPPAIEILRGSLGLSEFERALLLLCAGVELDGAFPALCAKAQKDAARAYATFSLALAALPEPHWSAITPGGVLRRWRIIEVANAGSGHLMSSSLRIDERVLHFLAGIQYLDERLAGLIETMRAGEELVPSHAAIAGQIADAWQSKPAPLVHIFGADESTRRAIVAEACARVGLQPCAIAAETVPGNVSEMDGLLRLWQRESTLSPAALYIEAGPVSGTEATVHIVGRLLDRLGGVCVLGSRERWRLPRRQATSIEVRKPTAQEQRSLWDASLGSVAAQANGYLPQIVTQFSLNAGSIRVAARQALASTADDPVERKIWDATRLNARPMLDDLAQRIEPAAGWDDLVLPEPERRQLREIAAHVSHRHVVYDEWGFAALSSRGLGISALFSGASGTGKTMAAEVLAGELRLDLYRIDLSCVVSKYIGETEKNLRRVFDAAEEGGVILFFDEADALFGKRSEVKDSHDRYANIEINYLLQRMESYRGLAVLATNMKSALDQAFLRRIRFVVNFPFPDAVLRAQIWRRVFPERAVLDGLDYHRLARLDVAGGNIRNIAMNAAFLAATDRCAVNMQHIWQAARSEFAKLERPAGDPEVTAW